MGGIVSEVRRLFSHLMWGHAREENTQKENEAPAGPAAAAVPPVEEEEGRVPGTSPFVSGQAPPESTNPNSVMQVRNSSNDLYDQGSSALIPYSVSSEGSSSMSYTLENGKILEKFGLSIGEGGFGSVFLGKLTDKEGNDQRVAVKDAKQLTGEDLNNCLAEEKEVYGRVPVHPNIVGYLGCSGKSLSSSSFIVLEYLPRNLHDAIFNIPEFNTYRHVLKALHGVAAGMKHLHEHGIVHFDLKPSNVLLTDDNTAKVADFGASKSRVRKSITATKRGTKGYMAPELLCGSWLNAVDSADRGKQPVTRVTDAVDIYSFGMLAFTAVTGAKQMDRETSRRLIRAGKYVTIGGVRDTQAPCDCPPELREMIDKCLQFSVQSMKDNEGQNRPSARELMETIEQMMNQSDWLDDKLTFKVVR